MTTSNYSRKYCHVVQVHSGTSRFQTPSGDCAIDFPNKHTQLEINIEDFCRVFAHCCFEVMLICRDLGRLNVNITSHFCDQLQYLPRKNIFIGELFFWHCKFIGIEIVDAIERILNSTQSYRTDLYGDHTRKDIFSLSSLRKLKIVTVSGASDFTDYDLFATSSIFLSITERCLSEHALRTLLELSFLSGVAFNGREWQELQSQHNSKENLVPNRYRCYLLLTAVVFYNPYCSMYWFRFCLFLTSIYLTVFDKTNWI
uniref:F-box/LRR-repeat protein n=1 Tax=Heterorhabditis bacteriophora TaxID=37862 RepID=A0A1I7W9Z4_HETBA